MPPFARNALMIVATLLTVYLVLHFVRQGGHQAANVAGSVQDKIK